MTEPGTGPAPPTGEPGVPGPPAAAPPRLRSVDLARVSTRAVYIQALFTDERMQGPGFAFAILPAIRRLFGPGKRTSALKRHMDYFNTHPVLAGIVLGAVARLEERRARGEDVSEERIDATKRALASPLAALGDGLFWVTLRPLSGLLGVLSVGLIPPPESAEPDWRVLLCPLVVLLTYNALALPLRMWGVARGHARAGQPSELIRGLHLLEWRMALERVGAFAYGALAASVLLLVWESIGRVVGGGAGHFLLLVAGAVVSAAVLSRRPDRLPEAALAAAGLTALLALLL
jgi:PTS system mannose-specific IID component